MARPKKRLEELSSERLRKLSPLEIERRKQLEHFTDIKQNSNISNEEINLKDIENISQCYKTVMSDLEFINFVIEQSKKNIYKEGLQSESINTFRDFVNLKSKSLKDLVFINKELRNYENNQENNFSVDDEEIFEIINNI